MKLPQQLRLLSGEGKEGTIYKQPETLSRSSNAHAVESDLVTAETDPGHPEKMDWLLPDGDTRDT